MAHIFAVELNPQGSEGASFSSLLREVGLVPDGKDKPIGKAVAAICERLGDGHNEGPGRKVNLALDVYDHFDEEEGRGPIGQFLHTFTQAA